MTNCPEKYREICENFVREYFTVRKRQIENNFLTQLPGDEQGVFQLSTEKIEIVKAMRKLPGEVFQRPMETALGMQVVEIARAAAGELAEDELTRGMVAEGIQGLLQDLFVPPGLAYAYIIPPGFWNKTLFGRMVRDAHLWGRGDELITQTAAAVLVGVSVRAVGQRIDKGQLTLYVDDKELNPQKNRRVSRLEVEAWKQSRQKRGA